MATRKPTRMWIITIALALAALMMVWGAAATINTATYESS